MLEDDLDDRLLLYHCTRQVHTNQTQGVNPMLAQ